MKDVKQLNVDLGERSYPIYIGRSILEQAALYLERLHVSKTQKLLLITDEKVAPLYGEALQHNLRRAGYTAMLYTIPQGESSKSFTVYEQVMTYALEQRLDRQSVIIALGGGVVGDLAGFVASTFMRGVPYIQMPTTLLAHDSSVGGKVAINHPLGKNMIGSFYQPLAVLYDTSTLQTLSEREKAAGFAEVLKHGLIWDAEFTSWLWEHRQPLQRLEEPYISEALLRGCRVKCAVVADDEKEKGLRAILNFGHTFGHAFEALGQYGQYLHGEAISIGMVLAARLSEVVFAETAEGVAAHTKRMLNAYGLPVDWQELPWTVDEVIAKMYLDKKTSANALNLVLLERVGTAVLVKNVDPNLIRQVW